MLSTIPGKIKMEMLYDASVFGSYFNRNVVLLTQTLITVHDVLKTYCIQKTMLLSVNLTDD
jgi:hypothetical protein